MALVIVETVLEEATAMCPATATTTTTRLSEEWHNISDEPFASIVAEQAPTKELCVCMSLMVLLTTARDNYSVWHRLPFMPT